MDRKQLRAQLIRQEGRRNNAYVDSLGFWTIGVGHLLGKSPFPASATDEQIDVWLEDDINTALHLASAYAWFSALSDARQNVIVNLVFNMGGKFAQFKKAIACLQRQDFECAGKELADSLWARQVKTRAEALIKQLTSGEFQ